MHACELSRALKQPNSRAAGAARHTVDRQTDSEPNVAPQPLRSLSETRIVRWHLRVLVGLREVEHVPACEIHLIHSSCNTCGALAALALRCTQRRRRPVGPFTMSSTTARGRLHVASGRLHVARLQTALTRRPLTSEGTLHCARHAIAIRIQDAQHTLCSTCDMRQHAAYDRARAVAAAAFGTAAMGSDHLAAAMWLTWMELTLDLTGRARQRASTRRWRRRSGRGP